MATKYTATHDGHTFTRTTKSRVYLFAVITKIPLAADLADSQKFAADTFKLNEKYNRWIVSNPAAYLAKNASWLTEEKCRAAVSIVQKILDAGIDGAIASATDRWIERSRTFLLSSDGLHFYSGATWTSRRDLAQKQAGASRFPAIILDAVEVVSAPRRAKAAA